jgi:hypothetical protein
MIDLAESCHKYTPYKAAKRSIKKTCRAYFSLQYIGRYLAKLKI